MEAKPVPEHIGIAIASATEKSALAGDDGIGVSDSENDDKLVKLTYDNLKNLLSVAITEYMSDLPFIQWVLNFIKQDSTFTCAATVRTCWGYVGDPSAVNPPRLVTGIPTDVQAIVGGRWVSADSRFYTTDTSGNTLNPYTIKSTSSGLIKVFTPFQSYAVSTVFAAGEQVAILTTAGNRVYMTSSGGTSDATAVVIADSDIGGDTVADNDIDWTVVGYATGLAIQLEAASENVCTDSREFDNAAVWLPVGTPGTTANEIGVDGVANAAYTLEDNVGASGEAITDSIAIPNDSNTHIFSVFVKKDAITSRFPALRIRYTDGGVDINATIHLNTSTGETTEVTAAVAAGFGADDYGEWWRLWVSCANNSSGHTTMYAYIYPANGSVFGTESIAATGSIVADQADVHLNQSFMDSPIITSGGTLVRAATLLADTISGRLSAESGAGRIVVNPSGSDQNLGVILSSGTSGADRILIRPESTNIKFYKVVSSSFSEVVTEAYSVLAAVPFVVEFYYNKTDGMGMRAYSVGDTPPAFEIYADTSDAVLGSDFEVGSESYVNTARLTGDYVSVELSINKEDLNFE
ncbi:MAG: hypothetical protein KAV87_07915 [Desulfobacteraceae bacterium]|nr:hypothetical protein [Desulfobacteraceae bacterium]